MTLTNIADFIGLSKSAAYQILRDLEKHNFVKREIQTKLYSLGPAILRLGYSYNEVLGLKEICDPVMEDIVNITGFTCYISIKEGIHSFLAYKKDSPNWQFAFYGQLRGTQQVFNCGCSGKLFAAYLEKEDQNSLFGEGFKQCASNSIINKNELLEEYEKIRERGYSTVYKEFGESTAGVAVPIKNKHDQIFASLAVVFPAKIYTEELVAQLAILLQERSNKITSILKFR
jgi:DNA-binding IclR family transcriptional regulator